MYWGTSFLEAETTTREDFYHFSSWPGWTSTAQYVLTHWIIDFSLPLTVDSQLNQATILAWPPSKLCLVCRSITIDSTAVFSWYSEHWLRALLWRSQWFPQGKIHTSGTTIQYSAVNLTRTLDHVSDFKMSMYFESFLGSLKLIIVGTHIIFEDLETSSLNPSWCKPSREVSHGWPWGRCMFRALYILREPCINNQWKREVSMRLHLTIRLWACQLAFNEGFGQ